MTILAFLLGIVLPTLAGRLMLDLLEARSRVLWSGEKWVLGFVVGLTFSMFCAFIGNVFVGIPLTLWGFLGIFGILILAFGLPWLLLRSSPGRGPVPAPEPGPGPQRWVKIAMIILGVWIGLRVMAFALLVLVTPPFFDDTMDNWNMRGKMYFFLKTFTISFPWDPLPGVSSYPPTVSLSKTWLSTIAGTWNEGLVNSIHVVWFIALLFLLYCSLRRSLPWTWAALGPLILASLPLELMQGTNAYADVFLSLHVFVAVSFLFQSLRGGADESAPWLRLSALAIALVPFTKNEGWALYFPVLALLFCCSLLWLRKNGMLSTRWCRGERSRTMAAHAALGLGLAACIVFPWIGFKVMHGLAFGNAKAIDWNLQWQEGVVQTVVINTFLEGNWGLLFALFFGLLLARWRKAFSTPLLLLTACFLIPYLAQLFLYMTTGLSTEALRQTGYARGLIHLMPVVVTLTVLLLHDLLYSQPWHRTQRSLDTSRI